MSGAEMTIKLVDGTEAEQNAFDRSPMDAPQSVDGTNEVARPLMPGEASVTTPAQDADGLDSESFAALVDRLNAIAIGLNANKGSAEGDKTTSADPTVAASVAGVHEELAEIAKHGGRSTQPQDDSTTSGSSTPTRDDFRELRLSLTDLAQRFTPKFFSDPIERLIAALAPKTDAGEQPVIPPPVHDGADSHKTDRPATIPAVGHVAPKKKSDDDSKSEVKQTSVSDILQKIQEHLGKTPQGRQINNVMNHVRKSADSFKKRFAKLGTSIKSSLQKSKTGRAILSKASKVKSFARNAIAKVAKTGAGRVLGGVGRAALGFAGRAIGLGATAASGAAVSGGTGGAAVAAGGTAVAAGGAVEAAGAAGAGVAGAAAMLNPVGLAVGAVVVALGGMAISAKLAGDVLSAMTEDIADKSGHIAAAKARQQMSTELNMIDRAKQLGPGMAQIEDSRTRFQDATQEFYTAVLAILVKAAPAIEMGTDTLTFVVRLLELGLADMEKIAALFTIDKDDDIAADKHAAKAQENVAEAWKDIWEKNKVMNTPDAQLMALLSTEL